MKSKTYKIIRVYQDPKLANQLIKVGLTEEDALYYLLTNPESHHLTCQQTAGLRRTHNYGPWWDEMREENN